MNNPEELLRKARYLWYSEKNAFRAQQILNGIMKDYPDTPEAESAKVLRDLIARSPAPGRSYSKTEPEEVLGCRQTLFRTLAAFLGVGFVAVLALWGSDAEPAWRAVLQEISILVFALILLDFAISGEARVLGWIGFSIGRITAGWNRHFMIALGIGFIILIRIIFE